MNYKKMVADQGPNVMIVARNLPVTNPARIDMNKIGFCIISNTAADYSSALRMVRLLEKSDKFFPLVEFST